MLNLRNIPRAPLFLLIARTISGVGSALTAFALDVWIFEQTGSYTVFALLAVLTALPSLVFAPFAGYLADRYPYKTVLLVCEALSAATIGVLALLSGSHHLNVVSIGMAGVVLGLVNTVAWPAAFAGLTALTPEQKRPAVNGLAEMLSGASQILSPVAGAALLGILGVSGILLFDMVSYGVGLVLLLSIAFPPAEAHTQQAQARDGGGLKAFMAEVMLGFRWLGGHKNLLRLLLLFVLINVGCSIFVVALPPYLLAISSASVLGWCLALVGAGMIAGGLLFSVTGGFAKPTTGVLVGALCIGACILAFGLARSSLALCACALLYGMSVPLANASSQTIWQGAVPAPLQGRVFSVRRMIAWGLNPLSILISIPLAQSVFGQLLTMRFGGWQPVQWWGADTHGSLGLMISSCGGLCVLMAGVLWLTDGLAGQRQSVEPVSA